MEKMYSKGKNDECLTREYGVEPLLQFIPAGKVIWCPFDKADSAFVRLISKTNVVIHSHIEDGQDFFDFEPPFWDIMISNPPFTEKKKYYQKAIDLGKPFCLLMTMTWLNDAALPKMLMETPDLQLLLFDKRMEFDNRGGNGKITFSSGYLCRSFLPRQIVSVRLDKH